jgi:hypothetical protein
LLVAVGVDEFLFDSGFYDDYDGVFGPGSAATTVLGKHDVFKLKTIREIFEWETKCMCGSCDEIRLSKLQMEHRYSNGNDDRNSSDSHDIYTKIWDFVAVNGQDGQRMVKLLFGNCSDLVTKVTYTSNILDVFIIFYQ